MIERTVYAIRRLTSGWPKSSAALQILGSRRANARIRLSNAPRLLHRFIHNVLLSVFNFGNVFHRFPIGTSPRTLESRNLGKFWTPCCIDTAGAEQPNFPDGEFPLGSMTNNRTKKRWKNRLFNFQSLTLFKFKRGKRASKQNECHY